MGITLSLDHISALVDPAPVPTWVSQKGFVVYVNATALALLRATKEDVLGRSVFDFIHPDYHEIVQQRIRSTLAGEATATVQEIYLRQDGTEVPVEVTAWSIPLEGGEAIRVSFVDISARLESDRRLRNSIDRFRRIISQAPFPILLHAEDGTVVQVSNALTELTGYGVDDIPDVKSWAARAYGEAAPDVLQRIKATFAMDRRTEVGEFRVSTVDGGVRHWSFSVAPVGTDESGRKLVMSAASDVTSRNRIELALRASEARFRGTFEQAAVGIAHVSLEGRWQRVNRRLVDILGYTEDELRGRTFAEITHPDDLGADLAQVEALLTGRLVTYSMEKRYIRQDGSYIWANLTVSLVRNESGEPDYFISVIEDISRRKAAEEEIRHLNLMLERRVEARTRQLLEANQELSAFAYSVSHDLREPLRAIAGFSDILRAEKVEQLDSEGRTYLGHIVTSALRMGELIDDILALSRVSRANIRRVDIDLSAVSKAILQVLQERDPGRSVEAVIQPSLLLRADARLLQILMENLLGNAWKYTGKTRTPRIEVGMIDGETRPATFFVRDNGAGFDMKHSARLFQPFQRLHRESEFEGSGIGLATVARIVHEHGGRVWAEGKPDEGATIYFTLDDNDA